MSFSDFVGLGAVDKEAPDVRHSKALHQVSFLCTRAPRGNMSAGADGCPARREEEKSEVPGGGCCIVEAYADGKLTYSDSAELDEE